MSFPSNAFRLEGAAVRNSYSAGRDLAGAVSTVELRVTDQQRQITSLAQQLAQANTEKDGLAARLAILEAWAMRLTKSE